MVLKKFLITFSFFVHFTSISLTPQNFVSEFQLHHTEGKTYAET
jgi:hypothetical protein